MADCSGLCAVIGYKFARSPVPVYVNGNMVCHHCEFVFNINTLIDKRKVREFLSHHHTELFDIVVELTIGMPSRMVTGALTKKSFAQIISQIEARLKRARCPCCNNSCNWRPSYRARVDVPRIG